VKGRREDHLGMPLLPCAMLICAMLACARADPRVPQSGPEALPTHFSTRTPSLIPTDAPNPTSTQTPTPQLSPTLTATPAEPEPVVSPTFPATPTYASTGLTGARLYLSQPGDTVGTLALRFGVLPEEISSLEGDLPADGGLIGQGRTLLVPSRLEGTGPDDLLVPDSEVVYSPHAADFNVEAFVASQAGFLARYQEKVGGSMRGGGEILGLVARDNSFNPRILLAMVEYTVGWVTDPAQPSEPELSYPFFQGDPELKGLHRQLTWMANELGNGYYGWRDGSKLYIEFDDGASIRLAPGINAGTAALQHYFATTSSHEQWEAAISPTGFVASYEKLFGDPWEYEHPLYEPGLKQPPMILPFEPGKAWSFTGGPHGAWEREAAWAALDFAPVDVAGHCAVSPDWVVAAAPGRITRSERGLVVIDLDGDGREQTGWVLLYLHVAEEGRIAPGAWVEQGDRIGHPSCEGGTATGTHIHMARKYNGEWILAGGPLPFELSGWVAHAGSKAYQGELVKGDQVVIACPCGSPETQIRR
jgi:LasA protease